MMEDGLYRNSQQIAQGKRNAVFPSLHSIRSDGVGKRMTKIIRENLPEGTAKSTMMIVLETWFADNVMTTR